MFIVPNEPNWARTDRRRQEPPKRPEPPEKLASFSHAHLAHVSLQLLSVALVTFISAGGKLGSFHTSISLETRRFKPNTPPNWVRFARFTRPSSVVGRSSLPGIPPKRRGSTPGPFSRGSSRPEELCLAQSRRDAECAMNHIHLRRYDSYMYVCCQLKHANTTIFFPTRTRGEPRCNTRRYTVMEGQSRAGLRQGIPETPSPTSDRNQELSSRRDAENAKKKGTSYPHPLRSWRLGETNCSLSSNGSRSSLRETCARKQDSDK